MRDYNLPARYLRANFEETDRLAVVLIDRERQGLEQRFATVQQISSEKYLAHLRASNAHGKDVFVSMNPIRAEARGRTKADVAAVKHLYLDLDKGGREALERIVKADGMPAPHHVLESSSDKFQLVWRVEGFMPTGAEAMMKTMAREYGADPAATDVSRVLRLPGFRNHKYEQLHFVRDTVAEAPARIYTPSDFPRLAERQAPKQSESDKRWEVQAARVSAEEARRQTQAERDLARTPIASSVDQSRKDFAFALRQLEQGCDPGVIRTRIAVYRSSDGKHPNVEDYAARTVKSAQAHHARRGFPSTSSSVEAAQERSGIDR